MNEGLAAGHTVRSPDPEPALRILGTCAGF